MEPLCDPTWQLDLIVQWLLAIGLGSISVFSKVVPDHRIEEGAKHSFSIEFLPKFCDNNSFRFGDLKKLVSF